MQHCDVDEQFDQRGGQFKTLVCRRVWQWNPSQQCTWLLSWQINSPHFWIRVNVCPPLFFPSACLLDGFLSNTFPHYSFASCWASLFFNCYLLIILLIFTYKKLILSLFHFTFLHIITAVKSGSFFDVAYYEGSSKYNCNNSRSICVDLRGLSRSTKTI